MDEKAVKAAQTVGMMDTVVRMDNCILNRNPVFMTGFHLNRV